MSRKRKVYSAPFKSKLLQKVEAEMLSEGYPEEVSFSDQYSFFCMAFSHQVDRDTVHVEKKDISNALENAGWSIHSSLEDIETTKRFSIFTPQVDASFYGVTRPDRDLEAGCKLHHFMVSRLDPSLGADGDDKRKLAETVFLRKQVEQDYFFLDSAGQKHAFTLHWLDLHFFNDKTGVLSFKATQSGNKDISSLALFHRALRDSQLDVNVENNDGEKLCLWGDVIKRDALKNGACLGLTKGEILDFDPYQRNAKVLMAAQLSSPLKKEHALAWSRPLMDPSILLAENHKQRLSEGDWDVTLNASRAAIIAGYATVRDMVLFELATVSDEGASLAWNGDKSFQYSAEYIRQMIDGQFVEVWEHWNALMLRDSCAMVSFDAKMPLVVNQRSPEINGQAENRYYPLYILTYHLRYSLDRMSEELIDSNLSDAVRSRELRERFIRFRNQYWFHEVTTDFLGREVYEKMKIGIGVDPAYESVKDEVDMVNAYIREKWAAYTAMIIALWSVISTFSGLPNGWLYICAMFLMVISFFVAVYNKLEKAIKMRNWARKKFKELYRKFLSLDLMHGC